MSSPSRRTSLDSFESPSPSSAHRNQYGFSQPDWSPSLSGYRSRRESAASSIGSINSALDNSSSLREGSQNAISVLLQPPIVRTRMLPHTTAPTSGHKPPTAKDIPPVTLTNIPHVEAAAFKPYLSQVGSLYEAFQRAKHEAEKEQQRLAPGKERQGQKDDFAEFLEKGFRKEIDKDKLGDSLPVTRSPGPRRRSSGALSKRVQVTPLSTIPSVYFDDNFHLENPRTFDVVSERSEVIRTQTPTGDEAKGANGFPNGAPPTGRKALATNAILQEKLSWYMDTVEVHLISSISTASTSFFAALGSLRDLQSEAAQSVSRIKEVREDLRSLDENMALGGLKIIGMKRRRDNLQKLNNATEQLSAIVQGVNHCEELVETGELELALDRMDIVEGLVAGSIMDASVDLSWLNPSPPARLADLRGLKALDGLSHGMEQLRFRVGKGFEARFLETLLTDLRDHIKNVPSKDTLQRWASSHQRARGEHQRSPSGFPAYLKSSNQFRADLQTTLNGLSRAKYTAPATAAFREAIVREMKSLIRQHLPSSDDDDAQSVASASTRSSMNRLSKSDKSSILARNLRALDPEMAEELLVKVYTNIGEALRRLSTQVKVLLDVTSGTSSLSATSPRSPPRSPAVPSLDAYLANSQRPVDPSNFSNRLQEELTQALDMSSLLGQAVDAAQTQITKVLRVRTDQTVRLPLPFFLRYFSLNRFFADECEAVSGRSGAALKGVVNSQITEFMPLFGEGERQRLVTTMDKDRWEAKDFGDSENAVLSRILASMTTNPPQWLKSFMIWEEVDLGTGNGTVAGETNGTKKEAARQATVDEESYLLVDSAIHALNGLDRFCNLVVAIPSMTSEIATILLDYLKLFASRTNQLVLGAGATVSAGLKAINTRHLALSYQALRFNVALIPYLREFIRRNNPSNASVLAEFDKVKRLYLEHGSSIEEKLIDIMCMRATVHVRSMKKIEWDSDTDELSQYIKTITKETALLQKTLSKYVPESIFSAIMKAVFESYREQWSKAFTEAPVRTEKGRERLLRDAQHFETEISKVPGAGDLGAIITKIARDKSVSVSATEPPAAARSAAVSPDAKPGEKDKTLTQETPAAGAEVKS